jgi:hypothetical protein
MRWWHVLRARLEVLFFRADEEAAMEEEIRFHLEMEARKLESQGHAPAEARRLARVRFGGEDRMKERAREERGTRWLEEMGADLRHGARVLRRSPGFALGAVLALALGIGSSTASYSLVKRVLLDPLPWAEPGRMVELRELGEGRIFYPSYPSARSRSKDRKGRPVRGCSASAGPSSRRSASRPSAGARSWTPRTLRKARRS